MLQEEPGVVGQHHEVFCLYRYRDRYHIAGHQASPLLYLPLQRHRALPYCGPRTMVVWRSPDVGSLAAGDLPRLLQADAVLLPRTAPAGTARRCTWEPT